uniref:Uncharacterized protein n=1 Tax=Amphimedon queenslandica TaxID=400682 RepID=A0A1X7UXY1_AMPQE
MISGSLAETGTEGAVEGSVSPIHDAQQLPVLPLFKGAKEDAEEDSFEEWVDCLEEMGVWCRCDDHKKLTQLRLRLECPARSFYKYKSYKGNFEDLVCKARLKRQSGRRQTLGQKRNQGEKSLQGSLVMTLKRNKGGYKCPRYGSTQHFIQDCPFEGWGAIKEARSYFVNDFESGLHKKLTGIEQNFEELVCKARFEEAKWKETNLGWTIDTTLEVPMNGMNGHTGDNLWLLGRDRDRGSVFIGNIPPSTKKDILKLVFPFGLVESPRQRSVAVSP